MDSWLIVLCWEMEAGVCYSALLLMSSYVVCFFYRVCVHTHTHTHTCTVWGGKTFYVLRIIQCAILRIQTSLAQYYSAGTLRPESDMERTPEVPASIRDEALFDCTKPNCLYGSAGKESACNAGDLSSIPRLGRSPGEGKGYLLQYSGLENSQRVQHDWVSFTFFHFRKVKNKISQDQLGNSFVGTKMWRSMWAPCLPFNI